jgi:hypothetical protein
MPIPNALSGKYPTLSYQPLHASAKDAHEAVLGEVYQALKPGKTYDKKKIVPAMTVDTLTRSGLYRPQSIQNLQAAGLLDGLQAHAEAHNNTIKSKNSRYTQDAEGNFVVDKSKHSHYTKDAEGNFITKTADSNAERVLDLLDPTSYTLPNNLPPEQEDAAAQLLAQHAKKIAGKRKTSGISKARVQNRMKRTTDSSASSDHHRRSEHAQVPTLSYPHNQEEANSMLEQGRAMMVKALNWQEQPMRDEDEMNLVDEQSSTFSQASFERWNQQS